MLLDRVEGIDQVLQLSLVLIGRSNGDSPEEQRVEKLGVLGQTFRRNVEEQPVASD